ncbi:MAG: hypothetical protein H8D77_02215 [Chloroflexi bacterium]|jgi:hypothetical protein|nr:hypothetical protein [Chloroflexota bacterium]MBL7199045.1 hypothetical protein [Anaerolineae bacterium]
MHILLSILTLGSWVLIAGLIYFLIRIAHFYHKKHRELYHDSPGQYTHHQFFWIPLFLFLAAGARYALYDDLVGDLAGDLAFLVGGVLLTALGYRLVQLMTGGRQ